MLLVALVELGFGGSGVQNCEVIPSNLSNRERLPKDKLIVNYFRKLPKSRSYLQIALKLIGLT